MVTRATVLAICGLPLFVTGYAGATDDSGKAAAIQGKTGGSGGSGKGYSPGSATGSLETSGPPPSDGGDRRGNRDSGGDRSTRDIDPETPDSGGGLSQDAGFNRAGSDAGRDAQALISGALRTAAGAQDLGSAPGPRAAFGPKPMTLAPAQMADLVQRYPGVALASGLQVRPGPGGQAYLVRMSDGKPPSPQEIDALAQRIDATPRAALKDPGFFSRISPEQHADLLSEYDRLPQLHASAFKDIAKSGDERDLIYSRHCDMVSGDCNEAAERSYKAGEFVPPDTLRRIWSKLRAKAEQQRRGGLSAHVSFDPAAVFARIEDVFGEMMGSAREGVLAVFGGPGRQGRSAPAGPGRAGGLRTTEPPAPFKRVPPPPGSRLWLLGLLLAGVAAAVFEVVRRKRKRETTLEE